MGGHVRMDPLTAEQQALVSDHVRLAWKYSKTNRVPPGLTMEEWESECFLVLVQAARNYQPGLGFKFSTYAYKCFRSRWARIYQIYKSKKQAPHQTIRLGVTEEFLPDHREEAIEAQGAKVQLDFLMGILSEYEREILFRRMDGEPLRDIGKTLGISTEWVRQKQEVAIRKMRIHANCKGMGFEG